MAFKPWPEVWKAFCKNNPDLGLVGSTDSFTHCRRSHGAALVRLGVMKKSPQGKVVLDEAHFDVVARAYYLGNTEIEEVTS
jgi:hypothetical protein